MLEKCDKHNVIDRDSPLIIDIYIEEPYLVVKQFTGQNQCRKIQIKEGCCNFYPCTVLKPYCS